MSVCARPQWQLKTPTLNKLAAVVPYYRVVGLVEYGVVLIAVLHFFEADVVLLCVVVLKALDLQKKMVKRVNRY